MKGYLIRLIKQHDPDNFGYRLVYAGSFDSAVLKLIQDGFSEKYWRFENCTID